AGVRCGHEVHGDRSQRGHGVRGPLRRGARVRRARAFVRRRRGAAPRAHRVLARVVSVRRDRGRRARAPRARAVTPESSPRVSPESDASFAIHDRFRALRHRNFRLYWSGQLVSLIGTWMQSVAQGWLMHRLTSSPFMLGLLSFLQFVPVLMWSLWAGVVADRVDKRRLLVVTQSCFFVQALLLAAIVTLGVVRPWMVLALAFAYGTFNAFDLPVRQAFLIDMVGKEDLSNGIALNSAAFNAARVIGPAIAGLLVASVGEGGCFWINALSYLAVIASLLRIRIARGAPSRAAGERATLMGGVRYALATG